MDVVRAIPFGAFLSWIVSLFLGTSGYRGGQLAITSIELGETAFLWSWPIFVIGTVLSWILFAMQR